MAFFLILFFISLAGIILMIGKKLILEKKVLEHVIEGKVTLEIPRLGEIKDVTLRRIKKYSFVFLVITIRYYVKSSNFLKKQGKDIIQKVKGKLIKKDTLSEIPEKQEVSGFLKMISEYKKKIKIIKRKIKEEESVQPGSNSDTRSENN
jgi:hypothetical protein